MPFKLTPAEFREKWAEALESGRFKQGRSYLTQRERGGDLDCCLGVACKLYVEHGGELLAEEARMAGVKFVRYGEEREGALLPTVVRDALGLSHANGRLKSVTGSASLPHLNDNGAPFPEIARLIREGRVYLAESSK